MNIAGKRVVVTGAGHGMGRAIATRMAAEGAQVLVNDLDADAAESVAAAIGGRAAAGDAASEAGVAELIETAYSALGSIDVYFANAGIDRGRGIDTSEDVWASVLEVNVMAHIRAARLLVPVWLESKTAARFVVTASAAGLLTMIDAPAYSVTKHAAVAFAEWLSVSYGDRGITVQCLCPQGVNTQMLERSGPLRDVLGHDSVLEPEQVAEVVWEALQDDRFLILPHPEVKGYYERRATSTDEWLAGMRRLQRRFDQATEPA
jgi:NAD(P)-dependent dehydrogenase (short-subunit alcohol dehydrogenase family)